MQLIKAIVTQKKDHSLTFSKSPQSTNLFQSNPSKSNHHLIIVLTVGAGTVILAGILVYLLFTREKKWLLSFLV